jgi:hypothetical protein
VLEVELVLAHPSRGSARRSSWCATSTICSRASPARARATRSRSPGSISRGAAARLGRGALVSGRWAERAEAPAAAPRMNELLPVPLMLQSFTICAPTVHVFNRLYRAHYALKRGASVVSPRGFFYPLDALRDWHRLYGAPGMVQHQCVLPRRSAANALPRLLELWRGAAAHLRSRS